MKKRILLLMLLCWKINFYFAQGEGNIWYFGYNAGLDFNTNPPTPLTNGQLSTIEGCASVSDKWGNLLFYTDGITVYDRTHNIMPNGTGLLGDPSSTQSAIVVPKPSTYNASLGRFDNYYIFTVDDLWGADGFRYSEVDVTLNGGLGDVVLGNKNTWLFGPASTEKITAVQHANGCDYWVIGKPVGSVDFYAYLITSSGVSTTPVVSSPGPVTNVGWGYLKGASNNQVIAMAHRTAGLFVYDFDNTTGILTLKFQDNFPNGEYGVEFSPDNNLLYATALNNPNIYQYDLTAVNNVAFQASRTIIGTTSNTFFYRLGALQLAPDGKIYAVLNDQTSLGVINAPNVPGTGCNYVDMAQGLSGRSVWLGLPSFPSFFMVENQITVMPITTFCTGDSVYFSLTDTTNLVSIQWEFTNLTNPATLPVTSNSFAPIIAFSDYGQYLVMAVQYTCYHVDTLYDTIYVNPTPVASFVTSNVCEYDAAQFNNTSTIANGNISFSWDFGDGNSSILQNPAHLYGVGNYGTYPVTLVVTSDSGCVDTASQNIVVHPQPTAGFVTSNVCEYDAAQFNNTSTIANGNISFSWDFGDGNSSILQNPAHLYGVGNYGTYPVTLVVTSDSACVDSTSQNIVVHSQPSANFTFVDDCVDQAANFTNTSTIAAGNMTWAWNLGDGNTDTIQHPSHIYSSDGQYAVTLVVTSDSGCTDTASALITRYPVPTALFTLQNVCVYDSAMFTDISTINTPDSITTWLWNFGDGSPNITTQNPLHLYNTFGSYFVNLTVISNNGCVDDTTLAIDIHPQPVVDFVADTTCVNTPPTNFTDLSTVALGDVVSAWLWDFNSGAGNSTLQHPSFNFGGQGNFPVTLAVMSDFGCWDTISKTITVYEKPTADFSVDTSVFCYSNCVNYADLSTSTSTNITNWIWDLDNGETSSSQNPAACYDNTSNTAVAYYSPTLIVQNAFGCYDTITKNNFITVWPLPLANFDAQPQPTDIYEPLIVFPNYSVGADSWLWNFGDGNSDSINYSPQHVYADSGTYPVILEVWNQYGCYDSTWKSIKINPDFVIFIPNAFTPDNLGGNETFFFKGYGIVEDDIEFFIFDRWGELIYYTQKFEPWDGTFKGQPVKQDVYVYKFIVKDIFDIKHQYIGSVTLLR